MRIGLVFCFLSALSFGLLGCVSKAADRRKCNASALVVAVFAWATAAMLVRTLSLGRGFEIPLKAAGVAVACGVCAAVAFFAFQMSIRIGKVTTGWLMMNLSAAVPAVVSIWIYAEELTPTRALALVLVVISLVFLFAGHRMDERQAKMPPAASKEAT